MVALATFERVLPELRGLAEVNRWAFQRSPRLLRLYEDAVVRNRFRYTPDPVTCELPDCWSSFRGLAKRYPTGEVLADCEDLACAHAGYLVAIGKRGIVVGLRPGKQISHAVCGEVDGRGGVTLMDPSVWAGMPPLPSYTGVLWMEVRNGVPTT